MEKEKPYFGDRRRTGGIKSFWTMGAIVAVATIVVIFIWLKVVAIPDEKDVFAGSESSESKVENVQFPSEKVLTISAQEYCDSIGKQLSDYNLIGVHTNSLGSGVPDKTEVIVGYRIAYAETNHTYSWYYGTALIPKKEGE